VNSRIHINIPVSNLDNSIKFYSAIFGVEPSKQRLDYANYRVENPPLHLALVQNPEYIGKNQDSDYGQHFGVELFDEPMLEFWKKRISRAGILLHIEEDNVTCCYAVANKFWLIDPDGNNWEFWVRTNDNGETLYRSFQDEKTCPTVAETQTDCC
jgi:catechol 2,3-dioxygenase-like lactoylglutathione lyase family enzyme